MVPRKKPIARMHNVQVVETISIPNGFCRAVKIPEQEGDWKQFRFPPRSEEDEEEIS